jgi:formylmethanofuran--tetrahydromethanopterin N-formyltransferase
MEINGVEIEDTFAEAFPMVATRAIITAETARWAEIAAREATGYATSVISCDAEAGVERFLAPDETPDGRPGTSILCFAFNREKLEKAVANRVGQCVMTCATTACYDGLPDTEKQIKIGGNLRYFGDGFQTSKLLEESSGFRASESRRAGIQGSALSEGKIEVRKRRFWRVPVMDGEFVCEDLFGAVQGVAGGNFLILARSQAAALGAAEKAMDAIGSVHDVIAPFPGGVVRSGSKIGSKYKTLRASTNDAYCPTLRGITKSALPDGVNAVYEIVIDGLSLEAVEQATRVGVRAACLPGVVRISAGNYGGSLGPHHIRLRETLSA